MPVADQLDWIMCTPPLFAWAPFEHNHPLTSRQNFTEVVKQHTIERNEAISKIKQIQK